MDPASLGLIGLILAVPAIARNALFAAVAIAGLIAAFLIATTRDDAFEAAGRQSKWAWVAIVVMSAAVCLLRMPFLSWFGVVAIGLYYFDVRPALINIIRGNSGW
ncbi:DUF2516 family protein [Corynebacterium liangguodongii]|uniref:DUF2516 domain-containing protein n=1 Tax=Corynebacterium liangguodongii TaxID=2079535 RepID=A0A2S0WBX3_9CORY|nr:DUF2516 family protein [Corynebacterium liangguodongii]AWB83267.1 DUF2516 domain-containing protein [Corynebacterium liangguodongii]PWC00643.1 DUF2516 domain-containing protein [Corynebacterium liangguodongii]